MKQHGFLGGEVFAARGQATLLLASLASIALHFALPLFNFQSPWSALAAEDIPLLAVIVLGGVPLAAQIFKRMFKGDLGADLLAAIALVTAALTHEYLAAVLIVIMLAGGQALETYARRRASSVLQALAQRMPSVAHRRRNGQMEEIAIDQIQIGDAIVVLPHEACPVDGTVTEGHGTMDESYLTGEPYRVSKSPGATVLSGAVNGDAALVVLAEKLAGDSRYAAIMKVMEEAEQKRPALRRLGDQIGAVFAPLALVGACAAWLFSGEVVRFLAVLTIATPCPLLIAIPVTVISAISMAARRGIIIKDPTVLERLPTCRTAIFDKTGTLTYGRPELTEILTAPGVIREKILRQAASLERYSKHPLASAFLKAVGKETPPAAEHISEKPGQGLSGRVEGQNIRITSRKKMPVEMAAQLPPPGAGLECMALVNENYAATFRFRDAPREEGRSFITHLGPSHQFSRVMLVSGDRESEVSYLAGLLGIKETLSGQSPEQKLALVRAEAARAPTFFMGDGINDAPALAVATVGVAFGQHSSVTAEAAGAVILENTLVKVDELIHLSAAMRNIALQSAVGGMLFSFLGMGFAAAGFISPVQGALLQEIIDVAAILNALRLTWEKRVVVDM